LTLTMTSVGSASESRPKKPTHQFTNSDASLAQSIADTIRFNEAPYACLRILCRRL
jgi:hypothetical protein